MVKKSTLDEYLRLLRGFGIRPVAVAGSSMGLANIFLHNRKDIQDKTYILADLKASSVEVLAVSNGAIAYSREVPKEDDQSWEIFCCVKSTRRHPKSGSRPKAAWNKSFWQENPPNRHMMRLRPPSRTAS